jgi:2-amino-4-hydroxy-6-hydroxymethyldihydropteridine diphosphokinase
MKRVFLSLGSNLGDRSGNIQKALNELAAAGIAVRRVSSFYRTEPVEYRQQPWFVNCVAEVATELLPMQLLSAVQRVEHSLGRRRGISKGPRKIDIDILLYENAVVRSAALNIPHESMAERRFVLVPLRELEAGIRHPVTELTVLEMLNSTADTSQVIRINPSGAAGEV